MALPRSCKVRVNPPAGGPVLFDFTTPRFVIKARPRRVPVHVEHEMLDRAMKRDAYGFRVYVDLLAYYVPGSTEETVVMGLGAYVEDDAVTFDLTLDSNVATPTWRPGYFSAWQTAPLVDKQMAGLPWLLTAVYTCEQLLRPGIVGSTAQPGQPGNYDVPWPTTEANW